MYRISNIMLLISTTIILFVGVGIIFNLIPTSSPIIAPLTVVSLFTSTISVGLKRKYKDISK